MNVKDHRGNGIAIKYQEYQLIIRGIATRINNVDIKMISFYLLELNINNKGASSHEIYSTEHLLW